MKNAILKVGGVLLCLLIGLVGLLYASVYADDAHIGARLIASFQGWFPEATGQILSQDRSLVAKTTDEVEQIRLNKEDEDHFETRSKSLTGKEWMEENLPKRSLLGKKVTIIVTTTREVDSLRRTEGLFIGVRGEGRVVTDPTIETVFPTDIPDNLIRWRSSLQEGEGIKVGEKIEIELTSEHSGVFFDPISIASNDAK